MDTLFQFSVFFRDLELSIIILCSLIKIQMMTISFKGNKVLGSLNLCHICQGRKIVLIICMM